MELITSIPMKFERLDPSGADVGSAYFGRCVESWRGHGFVVRTLNRKNEIDLIRKKFDLDPFPFEDDAEALFRDRFGPSFGDIFKHADLKDAIVISNADIFILPTAHLIRRLEELTRDAFLFAHRTEVQALPGPFHSIYKRGIDFVAFNPANLAEFISDSEFEKFKLGLVWWDYVLPIAASFFVPVLRVKEPFILHHVHQANFDANVYNEMLLKSFDLLAKFSRRARLSNPAAAEFAERLREMDVAQRGDRQAFAQLCIDWIGGRVGPIRETSLVLDLDQEVLAGMLRTTLDELTTTREALTRERRKAEKIKADLGERPRSSTLTQRWAEWWLALHYNWDLKVLRGDSPVTSGDEGAYRINDPQHFLFQLRPKIEALRVDTWGRFGNSVKQLVNVFYVAEKYGARSIYFAEPHQFFAGGRAGNLELVWEDRKPACAVPSIEGSFFHLKAFSLKQTAPDMARILVTFVRPLIAARIREPDPRVGEDDLILHFRSGDVFRTPELAPSHGQPPISYYLSAIEREQPARVWLVFEDRGNPCVDAIEAALRSRGIEVMMQSGTLAEDLRILMSARRLVAGRGTFAYWVAHLSERLRRVYILHKAGRMRTLRELGVEVIIAEDRDGEFQRSLLNKNWTGSPAQRALMLSYPPEKLRFSLLEPKDRDTLTN